MMLTTPAMASDPYTAEAPSFRTSTRSIAALGVGRGWRSGLWLVLLRARGPCEGVRRQSGQPKYSVLPLHVQLLLLCAVVSGVEAAGSGCLGHALSAAAARIRTVQSRSSVPRGPMPGADCTIASLSSSAGNSGPAGNGFSHISQIWSPSRPLTTAEWLFKCPRLSLFLARIHK